MTKSNKIVQIKPGHEKPVDLIFKTTTSEEYILGAVRDHINAIGSGFCTAKWDMATIWLSNGRTSSCHHPPAHTIELADIERSPSGLHNTKYKKEQRKEMIHQGRPEECSYCWRVEDTDPNVFSDRVIKSCQTAINRSFKATYNKIVDWQDWPTGDITLHEDAYTEDYNPSFLEISFDNLCNLACSYCNSEFSSTWASDLKKNGPYTGLLTSGHGAWEDAVEFDYDFKTQENIYVKKFFEWFNNGLSDDLTELRITGGEPTRSPSFWKLVDQCDGGNFRFSVNTNLMMNDDKLKRLVKCSEKFKDFQIFTSCETKGNHANFIRGGLDYDRWLHNLEYVATHSKNVSGITIMMTINALCLFKITEFMDDIIKLKKKFNNVKLFRLSLNILRFPSFQSVNMLPRAARDKLATEIESWLSTNSEHIYSGEVLNIERLVVYLREIDNTPEDTEDVGHKMNDFMKFYDQYGRRNGIDFKSTFIECFNNYDISWFVTDSH